MFPINQTRAQHKELSPSGCTIVKSVLTSSPGTSTCINQMSTANMPFTCKGMLQGLRSGCSASEKQAALACSQAGHLQGPPSRGVGAGSWQPSAPAEQRHGWHYQLRGSQGKLIILWGMISWDCSASHTSRTPARSVSWPYTKYAGA